MSDQNVAVDGGYLDEACQAAEAWAGALRKGAVGTASKESLATADRIDQAVHALRKQAYENRMERAT